MREKEKGREREIGFGAPGETALKSYEYDSLAVGVYEMKVEALFIRPGVNRQPLPSVYSLFFFFQTHSMLHPSQYEYVNLQMYSGLVMFDEH